MDIEQLRVKAKELGIKNIMNMKDETLLKRVDQYEGQMIEGFKKRGESISDCEDYEREAFEKIVCKVKIKVINTDDKYLKSIGFNLEWLDSIANRYDFNRFEYLHKCRAFRCYRDNNQIDWISVNDLSMLNGGRELVHIKLNYNSPKPIIKLPWRK